MTTQPKSFLKRNAGILILITSLLIALLCVFFTFQWNLSTDNFNWGAGLNMLGILLFTTLIVERVAEAIITFSLGEERANIERKISKLRPNPEDKTPLNSEEQVKLNAALDTKFSISLRARRYALFSTFVIGLLISMSGYNVLHTFFNNPQKTSLNEDFNEKMLNLEAAFNDQSITNNELYIKSADTFAVATSTVGELQLRWQHVLNSYVDFEQEQLKTYRKSQKNQDLYFKYIGILITALLITGGSEPIHRILSGVQAFLSTKDKFSFAQGNKSV